MAANKANLCPGCFFIVTTMNLKYLLIFCTTLLIWRSSHGQEKGKNENAPQVDVALEGMLGLSVGQNFYAFNVGGPSLQLVVNQKWRLGAGAFPSFYFLNGKPSARLGVGPRIDYKNLVFLAPFYHRDTVDEWIWSVGMGYKFHRKK